MFDRKMLLIKERVGFLKFVDTFDIYDPATGAQVGIARERTAVWLKLLRLLINKRLLPTRVEVRERDDTPVLMTLRRGFATSFATASAPARAGMPTACCSCRAGSTPRSSPPASRATDAQLPASICGWRDAAATRRTMRAASRKGSAIRCGSRCRAWRMWICRGRWRRTCLIRPGMALSRRSRHAHAAVRMISARPR